MIDKSLPVYGLKWREMGKDMEITYGTSWSFLGGDPKKRHNTVKIVTEGGKTKSITQVKSFATKAEAKQYADQLGAKR